MVMESIADQRASKIYKEFPDVLTTILAKPGEVQLHLKEREQQRRRTAEARVEKLSSLLEEEFADEIFSLPAVNRSSRLSATFSRCAERPSR